jgi:hypothetical protein
LKGRFNSNKGRGRNTQPKSMKAVNRKMRLPHRFASYDTTTTSKRPGLSAAGSTSITSTGSQTYTVPTGVDTINVTMYGGGAGGGWASSGRSGTTKGGGGGGGARLVIVLNEIAPGTVLTFNVGAGGADATSNSGNSDDGGDTTLSYGGVDYVAGGGEGNRGGSIGIGGSAKDGTGGAGDCDGGSTCTATAGNNGTAYNILGSTTPGGNSLETSNSSGAGAGGIGSNDASSQNSADGQNGKVVIT